MMQFRKTGLATALSAIVSFVAMHPVLAQTTCKLNDQVVPCESLGKVAAWGFGFLAAFVLIALALSIFWIIMLVHAATHPVENRPMWIIIMVFTGALGAIIYYFAVKRNFHPAALSTPAATQ